MIKDLIPEVATLDPNCQKAWPFLNQTLKVCRYPSTNSTALAESR